MRLGASLWSFYHERDPGAWPSLADAVRQVQSLDDSLGVEIWGARSLNEARVSGSALADLVQACRAMPYVTVHVREKHWNWNPAALRREIDFAHQLRAETLVLHPGCLGLDRPDARPDWPEVVRIADYASRSGVRLAVENIFDSVETLDRILEEIGDDPDKTNVGVCIDVGHAAVSHDAGREPVCNYLERFAGQLTHLHLHDNLGAKDDHLNPGDGIIDWPRVLHTVGKLGFSRSAILEVHRAHTSPIENIRRAVDFCRRTWR